jgi:hypothetical protein
VAQDVSPAGESLQVAALELALATRNTEDLAAFVERED